MAPFAHAWLQKVRSSSPLERDAAPRGDAEGAAGADADTVRDEVAAGEEGRGTPTPADVHHNRGIAVHHHEHGRLVIRPRVEGRIRNIREAFPGGQVRGGGGGSTGDGAQDVGEGPERKRVRQA